MRSNSEFLSPKAIGTGATCGLRVYHGPSYVMGDHLLRSYSSIWPFGSLLSCSLKAEAGNETPRSDQWSLLGCLADSNNKQVRSPKSCTVSILITYS